MEIQELETLSRTVHEGNTADAGLTTQVRDRVARRISFSLKLATLGSLSMHRFRGEGLCMNDAEAL